MPCRNLLFILVLQLTSVSALFSQTNEQLRANLYAFQDGIPYIYDGNLTMYDVSNSNSLDNKDAVKMSNFGENFGLQRGSTTLVIERRASITSADTIFFKMWNMRKTTYKIQVMPTGLSHQGLKAVFEDLYLNTRTNLDLNNTTDIMFDVTNVAASSKPDRFRIIFANPTMNAPLPVTFTNTNAHRNNNSVAVEWEVENQKNISMYQIERSSNGRQFFKAYSVVSDRFSNSSYKWLDNSPEASDDFYRISGVDISGHIQYSNIMKIALASTAPQITVYPNPVVNGVVNLRFVNQPRGVYTARIVNNFGQLMNIKEINFEGGSGSMSVQINKAAHEGNYNLEILGPGNMKTNTKIYLQ